MPNLEDIYLPVQRIIPFSNVEGIGNRTSIFLQGCNINCLYCHNPETIALSSHSAKTYSVADLLRQIKGTMPFIRGITLSGGEPTIHAKELIPLFEEVHKLGLTCYLDSNGFFPYQAIEGLIDHTDKFLFDIKGLGRGLDQVCFSRKYLSPDPISNRDLPPVARRQEGQILAGRQDREILSRNLVNLKKLLTLNKVEEVRLVYIKGFYDERETVRQIAKALEAYPQVLFKLIRVHTQGARGAKEIGNHMPSRQETQDLADFAKKEGLNKQVVIL